MDTHSAVSRPLIGLSASQLMTMGAQIHPVREVQRLELILTPASEEDRLKTIINLFKQFAVSIEDNPEKRRQQMLGYLLATEGYPFWAVIETGKAFIQGKVEGHTTEFMPKPPTIGRELAKRVDAYREKLGRMRRQAEEVRALEADEGGYGPRSPELKARGESVVAKLRAGAAEDRQRYFGRRHAEAPDPNPITADLLKDVPDAPKRGLPAGMQQMPVPDEFKNLKPGR